MIRYGSAHEASVVDGYDSREVEGINAASLSSARLWRRSGRSHRARWASSVLALVCVVILSACSMPGSPSASGATSPTATAAVTATPQPTSTVYVSETTQTGGNVVALDGASGSVLWRSKTYPPPAGPQSLHQTQGVLLTLAADGSVVALGAKDGAELWHTDKLYFAGEMVVDGNAAYVSRERDSAHHAVLDAYRVVDGVRLWHFDAGDCTLNGPAAASGIVVITEGCRTNQQFIAFKAQDGSVLWKQPAANFGSALAIANGVIYADVVGDVTALDAATGATKWRYKPSLLVSMGGTDVNANDQMVIAESSKTVLALHPQDGSLAWSVDFPGFTTGHVIAGDVVYVTNEGDPGTVTALRLNDGVRLWQAPLGLRNPWPPVAAGDILYISSDNPPIAEISSSSGRLSAIRMSDGIELWHYAVDQGGLSFTAVS